MLFLSSLTIGLVLMRSFYSKDILTAQDKGIPPPPFTRSLSENSIWRRAACLNAGLRQAQSPIYSISTHSPSLPAFKPLALGPDDEFSDTLLEILYRDSLRIPAPHRQGMFCAGFKGRADHSA